MKLVVLGLSLSSSWGNGHATTYRALLAAFAGRGHDILFLERDVPWYGGDKRDLPRPSFCRLAFYEDPAQLEGWRYEIAHADAVLVGSYVPDGIKICRFVQEHARGVTAFYDIDTPVTLAKLERGECDYIGPDLISGFDLYLSFSGGQILTRLKEEFGARRACALHCAVDPSLYYPRDVATRWDLSYLGTYSPDRQPTLNRLLLEPARRLPQRRFVVAGPQYPVEVDWPANVERIEHLAPADHADFYSASRFTLNVTRADMIAAGWSPSVRLFEAAACGTPIISDKWRGLHEFFAPGEEIILADRAEDVVETLESDQCELGAKAREVALANHTASCRAAELEAFLKRAAAGEEAERNLFPAKGRVA